jgi:hypothetical protein
MSAFWCSRLSSQAQLNGKHEAHSRAKVCCPRNGKQVPHDFKVDAATVFSYHCAQAWEGQTAILASPDTGQKVEAHG